MYICGIMMSFRKLHTPKAEDMCVFRTKDDFRLRGRDSFAGTPKLSSAGGARQGLYPGESTRNGVQAFQFDDSEYADDCMLAFPSRGVMERTLPKVYGHFDKFGMEIHAAPEGKAEESKSEVMFIPSPPSTYEYVDLMTTPPTYVSLPEEGAPIGERINFSEVKVGGGKAVPVVFEFVYLGSKAHSSCSDEPDVDARIAKASAAFGAASKAVFRNKEISAYSKGLAYKVLVLSVLLYGCESWALTQKAWDKLRVFHNNCTRKMCGVTTVKQWKTRGLTCAVLRDQLSIQEIESYVYKRSLAWLGHVAEMTMDRMPRKMLSCWVAAERTSGGQRVTYGKQVLSALRYAGIDTDEQHVSTNWPRVVEAGGWGALVENLDEIHAGLSPEQKGVAAAGSSPLRSRGTTDWGHAAHEEAEAEAEAEEEAAAAFVCADSSGNDSSESNDSESSSAAESDAESDDSDTQERRARASAAREQHTPRARSTRARRPPTRYTPVMHHAGSSEAARTPSAAARAPSSPLRAAARLFTPNAHVSSCLCHACCLRQLQLALPEQQQ